MPYEFASNWNNAAGLSRLRPQPASPGLQFGDWETSSLGLSVPQGRGYTILKYNYLPPEDLTSLLTQIGLSLTITSRKGTFKLKDNDQTWIIRNGYIAYPTMRRGLAHWEDVQFLVTGLRYLT